LSNDCEKLLTCKPISSEKEDRLRRYPLAQKVAAAVNNYSEKESFVIGIEGEWGEGKTSFLNLVKGYLNKDKYIIIDFNPWNFTDQNELIKDFFESVAEKIEFKEDDEHINQLKEKLNNYVSKLLKNSELTIEPEILGFKFGSYKFKLEASLNKLREEINQLFGKLGKKIVIVIDDIDRLDREETRLIFKLVKLTANFANTIFLLAYDKETICKLISEEGIDSEKYLQKIVQLNFVIPKAEPQDIYQVFFRELDLTLGEDNFSSTEDHARWGNLFHSGFKFFLRNLREVKRYISSLRLDLTIIGKEEINPIDFIGIEAIRVFNSSIYLDMATKKELFTYPIELLERNLQTNSFDEFLNTLSEPTKQIVIQLFPRSYGYELRRSWKQTLRVCTPEYFEKYFSLAIPPHAISELNVKEILDSIIDKTLLTQKLDDLKDLLKLRFVLDAFLSHIESFDDSKKEQMLINIFDYVELIKDQRVGFSDVEDIDTLANRLGYQTLKSILPEKRVQFLTTILENTQSTFLPVQLIETIENTKNKPLLKDEDLEKLKEICVKKIKHISQNGDLQKNKSMLYLLVTLKDWGYQEFAGKYVSELVKTQEGLFTFLASFATDLTSFHPGDYVTNKRIIFHKDSIADYVEYSVLNERIEKLDKSDLNPEQLELIELYNNPPKI